MPCSAYRRAAERASEVVRRRIWLILIGIGVPDGTPRVLLGMNHTEQGLPGGEGHQLTDDVLSVMRTAPLFSGLYDSDLVDLLSGARVETFPDGHLLFCQGDLLDRFFVVIEGHVEASIDQADGRRSVVEILEKPAILGESAMFGERGALVTARVMGRAVLVAVPSAGFLRKLERRFDLILLMLGSMSFRLRLMVRQIAELKLKTTAQRLGGFLLTLTDIDSGPATVRFPYDKRVVAGILGMKPESLSRALARLSTIGVRSQADNVVHVIDVARLRRFSIEEGLE